MKKIFENETEGRWNNSHIYKSIDDKKIQEDKNKFLQNFEKFKSLKKDIFNQYLNSSKIESSDFFKMLEFAYQGVKYLNTLSVYSSTSLSVNSKNSTVQKLYSEISELQSELYQELSLLDVEMNTFTDDEFESVFKNSDLNKYYFTFSYSRRFKKYNLEKEQEFIFETFKKHGLNSWGELYKQISSELTVVIDDQKMSMAIAANYLNKSDSHLRKIAYRAMNESWSSQQTTCAAILNSIYGFRADENKLRSSKIEKHYLDQTVHEQKVSIQSLNAMMNAVYEKRDVSHKAIELMASEIYGAQNKTQYGPWDVLAGFPAEKNSTENFYTYSEALKLIIDAFTEFDQDMGAFVEMMEAKGWIDASPSENRRLGAYCTEFNEYGEPRVFLTFDGTMKNVMTLAHELGHAYHAWVLKDDHIIHTFYPSTLAETASIFAESLVRQYLLSKVKNANEKKQILWEELSSISGLMVNIPMRFEFEKMISESRMSKNLSAEDFKELMIKASEKWYGHTLSEHNEMFWASKLHFAITEIGFYNYPYLFGYLFSLNLYAKYSNNFPNFQNTYKNLLKDTGKMTAKDLIQKYFNEDIESTNYWFDSIAIVEKFVFQYENIN